MRITLWGTRGSVAAPGPDTLRYGGNTSCVQVQGDGGTVLALDAGTGLRRLGIALLPTLRRVDILLTHLHLDHLQGLGFFRPLDEPGFQVHIWGPASTTHSLRGRLGRYMSPPLFPVRLRDLPSSITVHEVCSSSFEIGEFQVTSAFVCHPGPTVGYRITCSGSTLAYLPDHEPALGLANFPLSGDWTSGFDLAHNAGLLIHDAQYSDRQYPSRVGWGHSSYSQAVKFAQLAGVKHLLPFHHDPFYSDEGIDTLVEEVVTALRPPFPVTPAAEGTVFEVGPSGADLVP